MGLTINTPCIKGAAMKKNQQFIQEILPSHKYRLLTKFQNDRVKIVDFLLMAYFYFSVVGLKMPLKGVF